LLRIGLKMKKKMKNHLKATVKNIQVENKKQVKKLMQKEIIINEIKLELNKIKYKIDEDDCTNPKIIIPEIIKITENIEQDVEMFIELLRTQNFLNNVNLVNKINIGRFLIWLKITMKQAKDYKN